MNAQRFRRPGLGLVLIVLSICVNACHDPYAEVRANMSDAERARFDRGARAASACAACHDLAGSAKKIGPPLRGIAGRPAGSLEDYSYSPALSNSGVVWNARSLDAFIASPQSFVPGTRMMSPGVVGGAERSDLVFFLLESGPLDPPEPD
jgi:cytochrome c